MKPLKTNTLNKKENFPTQHKKTHFKSQDQALPSLVAPGHPSTGVQIIRLRCLGIVDTHLRRWLAKPLAERGCGDWKQTEKGLKNVRFDVRGSG